MIRVVFVGLLAVVVWGVGVAVWRGLRGRDIDWTGVAAALGFVAMAFWLRHITGMG